MLWKHNRRSNYEYWISNKCPKPNYLRVHIMLFATYLNWHAVPVVQKSTGKWSLNSQLTVKVMLMCYLQCLDLQVILQRFAGSNRFWQDNEEFVTAILNRLQELHFDEMPMKSKEPCGCEYPGCIDLSKFFQRPDEWLTADKKNSHYSKSGSSGT